MRVVEIQGRTRAWRIRHNAYLDYVFAEADRAGPGREVYCWDSPRLSSDPVGNRWQHQNGAGSSWQTDRRTGDGNPAVHLCASRSEEEWSGREPGCYREGVSSG